ncbi:Cj0814 family flagellar-dependent secreted protein, partial [Campylobacter coli]
GCNQNKEYIVTHIFNAEQFHEAQAIKYSTMNLGMNLMKLDFSPQSMEQGPSNEGEFNPDMSVYPQNEDGSYSKEALFMSFLKSYGSGQPVESPKTTLNPKVEAYNRAMAKESFNGDSVALNDIMTGKVDFASLLKGYAQDGWLDADIYAMEKGVAWQNTSIGYGGAWFDNQFNQAKANGWKASSESINSYVGSIMDRLNNLIGQTRV